MYKSILEKQDGFCSQNSKPESFKRNHTVKYLSKTFNFNNQHLMMTKKNCLHS